MRARRGPDLIETARGDIVTLAIVLVGKIVAAVHAAALLSRQAAAVHPAGRCQHGCTLARTEHVVSGSSIRLRNFGPERIQPRKRAAEPVRLAKIVQLVWK